MAAENPSSPVVIRRPQNDERRAALEMALAALPREQRQAAVAALSAAGAARREGLFAAWRGGRLVGAVWGEVQAGRAGIAQPPQLQEREPGETGLALLRRLEAFFAQAETHFFQIQLAKLAPKCAAVLEAAGLRRAGDLLYLVSDLRKSWADCVGELEFEPYRESERRRLADLLARTYQGSRDMPALAGIRTVDDELEGYRQTGAFRPQFWRIVRCQRRDIGCVLLAEHPPHRRWELVYLGVAPEARGKGYGAAISEYAQHLVRSAGGQRLLLAVDADNLAARRLYAKTGFRPSRRRTVYLKVLRDVGNRAAARA